MRIVAAAVAGAAFAGAAEARTATFLEPGRLTPGEIAAVSTAGDRAGVLIGLEQTFALLFDQPFGNVRNADSITIFTLAPRAGDARAVISFGVYNNGSPIILRSQNVNAGNSFRISNLFQAGCVLFGGCDFISITTDRARRGAEGVVVDYIDVNGEVTEVVAPAPEPAAWALLILGFAGLAWRLKAARRRPIRAAARSARPLGATPYLKK